MTDNTKVERIPLLKISVAQEFSSDLFYGDFLVHPKDVPITEEDMEAFKLFNINELQLRDNTTASESDPNLISSALNDSLNIMQKDIADMRQAQVLYGQICDFVGSNHEIVNKQARFSPGEPQNTIKQLIDSIRKMGSSILRFQEFQTERQYVEIHSTNSFILATTLASVAKMPQHRLMNLALSSLFHEVGLAKFSSLVNQNRRLNPQEFELQKAHVQEAATLLRPYNFPPEVLEGILQHHERLDGSGYPNGIAQGEISDFGRYLGLVSSYVAMTNNQVFRRSQLANTTAILTLIKEAKLYYDNDLVRLLVQVLSLYPVGSYVFLSNGAIGRVLRNSNSDPRLPMVQVLLSPDHQLIKQSTVIQTNNKLRVMQPIAHKKIAPLIARLQKEHSL